MPHLMMAHVFIMVALTILLTTMILMQTLMMVVLSKMKQLCCDIME